MEKTINENIATRESQAAMWLPDLKSLPNLDEAEVSVAELLGDYWTPAEVGEKKRVFFLGFDQQTVIDQQTGKDVVLDIVQFLEKQGEDYRTIRNGSARLVGLFSQFAQSLKRGTPFEITYLGKKKTTSGKFADNWSVKPLIVK